MPFQKSSSSLPKVIIIGPLAFSTVRYIALAFKANGWTAETVTWQSVKWRFYHRFGFMGGVSLNRIEAISRIFDQSVRSELIPLAKKIKPDLIVMVIPFSLPESTQAELLKLDIPMVAWATDSIERYPGQMSVLPIVKKMFVMDGGNLNNEKVTWMPLGFDEGVFQPSNDTPVFDLLFVGNISGKHYTQRRDYLRRLRRSSICKTHKIGYVGASGSWVENRIFRMPGNLTWVAKNLPISNLANIISRSRICINIHQEDGMQPVNPMFFAIPACGTCQIAENRGYLARWLRPEIEYCAVDWANFSETIENLLNNPVRRKQIADAGYQASRDHTFTKRVEQILKETL